MKNLIITIMTIGFIFSNECKKSENIWFKVSNNPEHMYGELMTIDMSAGYALYDEFYIYLLVLEKNTKEELIIMFPIGLWQMGEIEKNVPDKNNKKEKFDLDEYLKNNKGKGRIINTSIK